MGKKSMDKIYFTSREVDIIKGISDGLSNKEIANALFISTHTVKAHIENMFEKTELHNRVQLIVYAFRNRIIE
jgi:DNA-binding NarL/FixJ family response regulator